MRWAPVARVCTVGFGCASIVWAVWALPIFWRQADADRVAGKIMAGYAYRPDVLASYIDPGIADGPCRPVAKRSAAVLRLNLYEDAFNAAPETIDARSTDLSDAIRASLACSPSDPFLWLVLFSVESARTGFRTEYIEYLRMSYQLGPHEGWIAVKRNPVTLAIFNVLPPDIAGHAMTEYVELVDNGLYDDAAGILTGLGSDLSNRLLAQLAPLSTERRRAFAKVLYAKVQGVTVPGVNRADAPPWR